MRALLACVLLVALGHVPGASAYEYCTLGASVCLTYELAADDLNANAQTPGMRAGGGLYRGETFDGVAVHAVGGGAVLFAQRGEADEMRRTDVVVEAPGRSIVTFFQDDRTGSYPGAYHCTTVATAYARCGTGLP